MHGEICNGNANLGKICNENTDFLKNKKGSIKQIFWFGPRILRIRKPYFCRDM